MSGIGDACRENVNYFASLGKVERSCLSEKYFFYFI